MSEEIRQILLSSHSDSVLCCALDNRTRLAVTGGIDERAYVWDLAQQHMIFECSGHTESVVAVAFNSNSTYVATGDLNGMIQVRATNTGVQIFSFELDEINWLMWHNTSDFVLFAGTVKGDFWMWNVNDPAAVKTFPSYGTPTTTAKLFSDGLKIVTGYGNGSVRVFDLKTMKNQFLMNDPAQSEIICLDLSRNDAIIAAGCIDSSVKLINLTSCRLIGTLFCKTPQKSATPSTNSTSGGAGATDGQSEENNVESDEDESCSNAQTEPVEVIDQYTNSGEKNGEANDDEEDEDDEDEDDEDGDEEEVYDGEMGDPVESVESILFSPCGRFLAASNNLGSIYIWDVATQATRCEVHTGIGITRSAWTEKGNYITGCLDGAVRIYDSNLKLLETLALHTDQILDLAYKNKILITASEDRTCRGTMIEN